MVIALNLSKSQLTRFSFRPKSQNWLAAIPFNFICFCVVIETYFTFYAFKRLIRVLEAVYSVTRLGVFWNFFSADFLTKVAQIFDDFLGYDEKHHFLIKSCFGSFLGNGFKIWASFSSNIWSHWQCTKWIMIAAWWKCTTVSVNLKGQILYSTSY